jgi:uncharacterized membrane protein
MPHIAVIASFSGSAIFAAIQIGHVNTDGYLAMFVVLSVATLWDGTVRAIEHSQLTRTDRLLFCIAICSLGAALVIMSLALILGQLNA